jgi:hypothetical protein
MRWDDEAGKFSDEPEPRSRDGLTGDEAEERVSWRMVRGCANDVLNGLSSCFVIAMTLVVLGMGAVALVRRSMR